jgi:hypothetical protein
MPVASCRRLRPGPGGTAALATPPPTAIQKVLAVRGQAPSIKKLADAMIAAKGVKHGQLTITTTGKNLPA